MTITQIHTFFIIVAPGIEDVAENELIFANSHFFNNQITNIKKTHGGISIDCEIIIGISLNIILKTPARILLRIDNFKCKDAPKLFNKTSKIPWSNYLISSKINIESSSSESRLFDSRKIEKSIKDAVTKYVIANPIKAKFIKLFNESNFIHNIYARFENDDCTISIDTTGELLHFRGEKALTGSAPIRENLACAMIKLLIEGLLIEEYNLIDPMCGSGTFLIEGYNLNRPNLIRKFSFMYSPFFLKMNNELPSFSDNRGNFKSITGLEIDEEICQMCIKNISALPIKCIPEDLFNLNQKHNLENNLVIVNPPYGIRVKTEEIINSKYYFKILTSIIKKYLPKRIGIIIPSEYPLLMPVQYKLLSKTKLKNGGINISFYVLETK